MNFTKLTEMSEMFGFDFCAYLPASMVADLSAATYNTMIQTQFQFWEAVT